MVLASPIATIEALGDLWTSGQLTEAWGETVFVLLAGLAAGSVVGTVLGLLLGRYRALNQLVDPLLNALFVTPKIATIPLLALWFGFQDPAKIVLVFLFGFFQVFFMVRRGVQTIDAVHLDVARSFCVPERVLFRQIIVPAVTPFLITGLRLGLLHGMVGVVLAGFLLDNNGIGGLIFTEAADFKTAYLLAALFTVAVVGVIISSGLRMVQSRIAPWQQDAMQ